MKILNEKVNEDKLASKSGEELKKGIQRWLKENGFAKLIDTNSDIMLSAIAYFYNRFRTLETTNPFMSFLIDALKEVPGGAKLTPDQANVIANKYDEHILLDKDLRSQTLLPLFKQPELYKSDIDSFDYYIDIYSFLSDKDEINKIVAKQEDSMTLPIDSKGENQMSIQDIKSNPTSFRDAIMFDNGTLKSAREVEQTLNKIAEQKDINTGSQRDTSTKLSREEKTKIDSFFKDAILSNKITKSDFMKMPTYFEQ